MTSYRQPGTVLSDLTFTVPLDHARPDGEQIEVFARQVVAADQAAGELPWLVFLQGGPGMGAPRPAGREGWLDRALTCHPRNCPGRAGRVSGQAWCPSRRTGR
jgi:hypothetical protein